MKDYSKSRRSFIRKDLENSPEGQKAELAKSANATHVENATTGEAESLAHVIKNVGALGAIYLLAKYFIQEDHSYRTVEAVQKAKVDVEELLSPASDEFVNLFSPGAVTAIVSAL